MNIETSVTKKGVMYRTRFMENSTQFRSPWLSGEQAAVDWAIRKKVDLMDGIANTGSEMKLRRFAEIWLERYAKVKKVNTSARRDEQNLRIHILPVLGERKLRLITFKDLDFLFTDIMHRKKLAPKTINNMMSTVKKMLRIAVQWGFLRNNPAESLQLIRYHKEEPTIFHDDELRGILSVTRSRFPHEHRLILFALNVGARLGECLALQWSKIDLEKKFATISSIIDGREFTIVDRTKGKRSRKIPLNQPVYSMLREMALNGEGSQKDQPVFTNVSYKAMTYEKMRQILKAAGCHDAIARKASFHSFRHTFASRFMRNGGNIYELQQILGHQSVKQTEQYSHFSPMFLSGATDRVAFDFDDGNVIELLPNSSNPGRPFA